MRAQVSRARALAVILSAGIVASLPLVTSRALAEDKQSCLSAFDKAQQLRIDGKLRAAREQLAICSRAECPALVRQDCSTWTNEVMSSLPSIVIGARDGRGKDLFNVRVLVDGNEVATALDGKPILVDPGAHKFRYETAGSTPIEEQVLIREGERNRQMTVSFGTPKPPRDNDEEQDNGKVDHRRGGIPVASYVLAGVGVVGLGAALYFDLKANGDAKTLRAVCSPYCLQSDVDSVQTKYVAAVVSLSIGVVALGVATVLYLTRGPEDSKRTGFTWYDGTVRF